MLSGDIRNRNRSIMLGAVFGGLAFTLGLLPLSFPFPPIPFLRFDLAEVPSFVALFMFGPGIGFVAAFSHFLALLVFGEWSPIGPLMKFLAVCSSMLGFWAAASLTAGRGLKVCVFSFGLVGAVSRILVTSLANYILLTVLFPFFLDIAAASLAAITGLSMASYAQKLFFVLLFTAIYNALHIPFSILPAYLVTRSLAPISPVIGSPLPWIVSVATSKR
ncbi:MAG: hypothetical protein QXW50_06050 [Nitrososphaerota archaeon]